MVADIEQGQPFSRAAEDGKLTTSIALRVIAVGERSGQCGDIMKAVAGFYDEDTNWAFRGMNRRELSVFSFLPTPSSEKSVSGRTRDPESGH